MGKCTFNLQNVYYPISLLLSSTSNDSSISKPFFFVWHRMAVTQFMMGGHSDVGQIQ